MKLNAEWNAVLIIKNKIVLKITINKNDDLQLNIIKAEVCENSNYLFSKEVIPYINYYNIS